MSYSPPLATYNFLSTLGIQPGQQILLAYGEENRYTVRATFTGNTAQPLTARDFIKSKHSGKYVETGPVRRWPELQEKALEQNLFWLPSLATDGRARVHIPGPPGYLYAEIDTLPLKEQKSFWAEFTRTSGLEPAAIVFTGGKSLHAYFRVDGLESLEHWEQLQYRLCALASSDPAVTRPHQPMRLPGFQRRKAGEIKDVELLEHSSAVYSVELVQAAFDEVWPHAEPFTEERWKKYLGFVAIANNSNLELPEGITNPSDAFNLPDAILFPPLDLATDDRGWTIANPAADTSWSEFLDNSLMPALERLPLDQQFGLSGYDSKFKQQGSKLIGLSPFSQANSTGTAFHVSLKDGSWCCHSSGQKSKSVKQFLQLVWYGRTGRSLSGSDFIDFCKRLAREINIPIPEALVAPRKPQPTAPVKPKENSQLSSEEQARNAELERLAAMHAAFNQLTVEPTQVVSDRYLPKGNLPEPGSLLLIDAAMGTGKTASQLKGIVEEHRQKYPLSKVLSLVSRNVLGRQQATELGLTHQENIEGDHGQAETWVGCPNSMYRITPREIPENSLLILDEMEALVRYILMSGTLKEDRILIIGRFRDWLRHILNTGGFIVAAEDGLTDLSVEFIKSLVGFDFPIQLIKSNWKNPTPYPVTIFTSSSAWVENLPSSNVVIASDGVGQVRELSKILPQQNTLIASGDTSHEEQLKNFADDPNQFLKSNPKYTNLVYSPTLAEGVSITEPRYEVRGGYFTHLPTRDIKQQLNRYRPSVPTLVYCKQAAVCDNDLGIFDPKTLIERTYEDLAMVQQLTGFAKYLQVKDESLVATITRITSRKDADVNLWLEFRSKFEARDSWDKRVLRENLIQLLKDRGHPVTVVEMSASKGFSKERRDIREQIDRERSQQFAATAIPDELSISDAHEILRTLSSTPEQRIQAKKLILQDELKKCNFDDPEFVYKSIIGNRGRFLAKTRQLWRVLNIDAAKSLDRWTLLNAAERSRTRGEAVWLLDLRLNSIQAEVLANSPLIATIESIKSEPYDQAAEPLQELKQWAVNNAQEIFRKLRLTIKPDQSAVSVFNRLVRRLGYVVQNVSKKGARGQRSKQYQIVDYHDQDRANILQCLTDRYEASLERKGENRDGSLVVVTPAFSGERIGSLVKKMAEQAEQLESTPNYSQQFYDLLCCRTPEQYQQAVQALGDRLEAAWSQLPPAAQQRITRMREAVAV